jgi:cytochrome oxidase Cu insertion factor (SCO1/SenC/PrrC family)
MRQHYRLNFVYLALIALLFCIQFSANSEAQDSIPEATEPVAQATEVTAVPSEAASGVPTQESTPVPTEP